MLFFCHFCQQILPANCVTVIIDLRCLTLTDDQSKISLSDICYVFHFWHPNKHKKWNMFKDNPEVFIKHETVVINWAYEELLCDMKVIIHEEKKNSK